MESFKFVHALKIIPVMLPVWKLVLKENIVWEVRELVSSNIQ